MTLVDSSGWIEFFIEGPLAKNYAGYLQDLKQIVTPTIVLYEVYKVIKRERSEEEALVAVAQMGKSHVIPLTEAIALTAADVSLKYGVAMADAVVFATSITEAARLVTSDADLSRLPGVTYLKKS